MTMAASLDSTSRHGTCHRQCLLAALRHEEVTEEYTRLRCSTPVNTRMEHLELTSAPHNTPSQPVKPPPRERFTEERSATTTVIGGRLLDGEIALRTPAAINEWKSLGMMEKVG
jgi:hypothetical protein